MQFEIGVPVLGNRLFVLNYSLISVGIFVKALPHMRCVAAFTDIPVEIMHAVCTKVNLKSDFHIAGQLMETHGSSVIIRFHPLNSSHHKVYYYHIIIDGTGCFYETGQSDFIFE